MAHPTGSNNIENVEHPNRAVHLNANEGEVVAGSSASANEGEKNQPDNVSNRWGFPFIPWQSRSDREGSYVKGEDELVGLRRARSAANDEMKKANDIVYLQGENAVLKKRNEALGKELENLRAQTRSQENQIQRQYTELSNAATEIRSLRIRHQDAKELLATRTSELQGTQEFLTKADSISGDDFIKIVQKLNAEVFQTATYVAESFEFQNRGASDEDSADILAASAMVTGFLGDRMVHLLRSFNNADDPTLIQTALQTTMLEISERVTKSWYLKDWEKGRFLQDIYAKIYDGEDDAVAGRWGALTRRYGRLMARPEDEVPETLISYLVDTFVGVLVTARCSLTRSRIDEIVRTKFMERIIVLCKLALGINKAIGEEITSSRFTIIYVKPGGVFNPNTMLGEGGGAAQQTEQYICATDLGLVCAVKKGEVNGYKLKETILLKPRVMLESSLVDIGHS